MQLSIYVEHQMTFDRANRSHIVSLPMILKKLKLVSYFNLVYKFTVSPYFTILDSDLCFNKCSTLFWAEMSTFCFKHIENRKIFL